MPDTKTIGQWLSEATGRIQKSGSPTAAMDARLLLCEVVGLTSAGVVSQVRDTLHPSLIEPLTTSLERRLAGEPVHRILGWREFYGRRFTVSEDTLIPRPDTETVIDVALEHIPDNGVSYRALDLGTGSGVIAVTLAAELAEISVAAVDISEDALATAKMNARKLGVEHRVEFAKSDVFENVQDTFDLIVSNPPYIPNGEIDSLHNEVRFHDPIAALAGGTDGLDFYRAIFAKGRSHLVDHGSVIVEIGAGQHDAVCRIARENEFAILGVISDINGIARVISARVM